MKKFTLRKLGLSASLLMLSCVLLTAQEKSGIVVIKKIKKEDGTVVIEKEQLEADALLSGYLKKEGKIVGNDVEIHLADAINADINLEETGETLIFVRSAAGENTDAERVRVTWHERNDNPNSNLHFNDNNGLKQATGRTILGIYTDEHADVDGLRISSVSKGKGAEAAGLRGGDVITAVAGRRITSSEDLRAAIGGYGDGQQVEVAYLRDGKPMTTIAKLSAERLSVRTRVHPCKVFIGVGTNNHNGEGVKVDYVIDDTPAAVSGIQAGDIILALDGAPITNQQELTTERDKHQPGEAFQLKIQRGDQPMTINASFKACSEEERAEQEEKMAKMKARMAEMRERRESLVKIAEGSRSLQQEQRPVLGVYTDDNGSQEGLRLSSVSAGKGAQLAGIRGGDILTMVNGKSVKTTSDLREAIADRKPGDRVPVSYLHDGELRQTEVVLSGSLTTHRWTVQRDPCEVFIGIYSTSRGTEPGVRVTGVIEGTSARKYGLQRGDVILALDDVPVNNHNEVITERDRHKPGEWYTLSILRDGRYTEIEAQFNSCNQEENEAERMVEVEEVVQMEEQEDMPQETVTESELPDMNLDTELEVEAWRMYPNPTVGILNVNFRAEAAPTTIRITDATGKIIYNEVLNQFDGYYNNQLNLGSAPAGNYILTVQQAGKIISKKIALLPKA